MLTFTFFCTVTLLALSFTTSQHERRTKLNRRLAMVAQDGPEPLAISAHNQKSKASGKLMRMLHPLWRLAKRGFKRRTAESKLDKLELRLQQAGQPFRMSALDFRLFAASLQVLLPLALAACGIVLGEGLQTAIPLGLVGLVFAYGLPRYYIYSKSKQRAQQALKELPDVLDLLTVSLEAGLGFDAALSKLVGKKTGVLPDEFRRCLEEIRLGRTRREALSGVRERITTEEVRLLISSILQAERLGIGMVQVLRVQSQEARDQRKQRAEEEAMKTPIKILFPLILFIFPSLFIVLLGPALIQFLDTFSQ